jgi:hypothetical protein
VRYKTPVTLLIQNGTDSRCYADSTHPNKEPPCRQAILAPNREDIGNQRQHTCDRMAAGNNRGFRRN